MSVRAHKCPTLLPHLTDFRSPCPSQLTPMQRQSKLRLLPHRFLSEKALLHPNPDCMRTQFSSLILQWFPHTDILEHHCGCVQLCTCMHL